MDAFERIKAEALGEVEEDSGDEDDEDHDVFNDEASADTLSVMMADTSDPEELKRQLKE